MEQRELWIESTLDGTLQPSLFYGSASEEKRPLLVGLHTWSFDRFNQVKNMLPFAEKNDFNLLLPNFRGNNKRKNPDCVKACGSEFAKQDIQDAIDYVIENENVDRENVFLLGSSGGGHMALLMAGKCPEYFKAIGAFVPITDLNAWYDVCGSYQKHIAACCEDSREEMAKRSPITYLDTIAKANVKIFHGKFDPVVPVGQSISFFQEMMAKYPRSTVYLDIFDGGHHLDMRQAAYWILSQYKKEKKIEVTG
ncbi:MAG: prolyl oligopeptidase family serine peptidase [Clostridia bacterium]|nr:prolyl oligopeptidase family serine peptidase [Clostridia bacterium]